MTTQFQRKAKARFKTASKLERNYINLLKTLTGHINDIVDMTFNIDMNESELYDARQQIQRLFTQYSEILTPWAEATAEKIITRIYKADENEWIQYGRMIGRELKKELQNAPTGSLLKQLMAEQVHLIKSLPLDAARRVHEIAAEGITEGTRSNEIARKILETGKVTKSRAELIARTEVARTAATLTKARALHVGATHYYWRTSGDSDVRPGHKVMNGKICEFNNPPIINEGTEQDPHWMKHGPGEIWNCRCYAEPILDDL